MFTISSAAPFNIPGEKVTLTRAYVWRGLEMRARNEDERFVPPGHEFEVIEDSGREIFRRVRRAGQTEEIQRVTLHGDHVVVYDFIEGGQNSIILNSIETDDAGTGLLRFTYLIEYSDVEPGSEDERSLAEQRRPAMAGQPARVLQVIRQLVKEQRIS